MEENNETRLYESLLDVAELPRGDISRELLKKKVFIKPLKSKYMVYESCFIWQLDLIVLPPNRSKVEYVLVCVDVSTRKCDAEPLTFLQDVRNARANQPQDFANTISYATLIAYGEILQRGLICGAGVKPKLLYVDGGVEFQGTFARAVKRGDTKIRTTVRGRKQQNAIVEHTNEMIKFGLMSNAYRLRTQGLPPNAQPRDMSQIYLFSGNILPKIVQKINEWATGKFPLPAKDWFKFDFDYNKTDLQIGEHVYIPKLFSTRFKSRSGQHNFLKTPYVITNIFTPTVKGQPYRFMTSFSKKVTFKRDEIIKVDDFTKNMPII